MKLITKAIEKKMLKYPIGSQDGKGYDAEVIVKYFTPDAQATWLIIEGEKYGDDYELFGLCDLGLGYKEWGYVLLSELKKIRGCLGLPVERDLYIGSSVKVKDLM